MAKVSKVLGALLLCGGLCLMFTPGIAAQEQQPAKPDKAQKSNPGNKAPKNDPAKGSTDEQTVTLNGKVKAVTASTVTIVDDQKAEHTVAVTTDTKVTKNGKDCALSEVKADDTVTIVAKKGDGDAWTALQIAVS